MKRAIVSREHIAVNQSYEGERIEEKVARVVNNKEAITDGAPLVYQERKDGVQPAYDIRADKWDIAIEAMDKVAQAKVSARVVKMKEKEAKKEEKPGDPGATAEGGDKV